MIHERMPKKARTISRRDQLNQYWKGSRAQNTKYTTTDHLIYIVFTQVRRPSRWCSQVWGGQRVWNGDWHGNISSGYAYKLRFVVVVSFRCRNSFWIDVLNCWSSFTEPLHSPLDVKMNQTTPVNINNDSINNLYYYVSSSKSLSWQYFLFNFRYGIKLLSDHDAEPGEVSSVCL